MIRVLQIFGTMDRGGAEMRALDIMRYADRQAFSFEFLVLSGREGALDGEIRSLGGAIHYRPKGRSLPAFLRHHLRHHRYAVVHSHIHLTSGLVLMLAARGGVPIRIAHIRTTDDGRGDSPRRLVQRRVMRYLIDRYATAILAVSEAAMAATWGPGWRTDPRCRVVRNGIDPAPFQAPSDAAGVRSELGLAAAEPLCINVGSFQPVKNHLRLLDIFHALRHDAPRAALVLVGGRGAAFEQVVRDKAARLGLEGAVVFTGERADVPRLLKAADVMIHPSTREGSPGAVLEAVAAGLPIVASDIDPIREIARFAHPLLRLVDLESSDEEWARTVRTALRAHRDRDPGRGDLDLRTFWSEFDVRGTARLHEALWMIAGETPNDAGR